MSVWTHINGSIRYDDFLSSQDHPIKFLGNTCNFYSSEEQWDKCDVPCGSEGSINFKVYEISNDHSAARWAVSFWGDLRDYKEEDIKREVLPYFERITKGKDVRQATIEILCNGKKTILTWDEEKKKLLTLQND